MRRSIDQFPKQGLATPWRLHQNYMRDVAMLRYGSLEDEVLELSGASASAGVAEPVLG